MLPPWLGFIIANVLFLVVIRNFTKVKFYLKFVVFSVGVLLALTYYSVTLCFRGRDYTNAWYAKRAFWFGGYIIGLKPIIKDGHFLDPDRPCVYVSNHQSYIDVASLADIWPKKCTIISKSSVKYLGSVGFVGWLSKLIFVDRSKHKDAISAMKFAASEAKKQELSVFVFPEGTRSCTGEMRPFKKGAFHLAIACQFPIQPIVVSSYTRFIDYENKRFDEAKYYVQVLPPISTTGMTEADVDRLLNETQTQMAVCLEQLKTKIPS